MSDEKKTLIEDVMREDGFGFRLKWRCSEFWCDITAYEIIMTDADNQNKIYFNKKDWISSPDPVETIDEAEPYLNGFVKWDGCSEFDFGHVHWCGPRVYKTHFKLLEIIYRRTRELLNQDYELWDEK